MLKKALYCSILFLTLALQGVGQQILQLDFNAGGGVINNSSNSISFSIGQSFYSDVQNSSAIINGGFQQGLSNYLLTVVTDSVDCNGTPTGAADLTIGGGSSNYTIQWSSGQTNSNSIGGLTAGNYQVTTTDAFGIQSDTSFDILQPEILSVVSADYPQSIPACLDGIAQFNMIVNGGTAPYDYNWSNATDILGEPNSPNPIFYPINAFAYLVTVTDYHGCVAFGNQNLEISTTGGWFEGTITYGGIPVGAGDVEVFLFPTDYALGAFENVDLIPNIDTLNFPHTAFTDANGRYRIQGNQDDVFYYLLARPRNLQNIPDAVCTYFDYDTLPVYQWQNADSVFSNCGDTTVLNIPLVETSNRSGPGRVWGYIRWNCATCKTETNNEPIPLIDVVIEKDSVPSSIIIDYNQTDTNGYYEFDNLPVGNGECYQIYVNYAGLNHRNLGNSNPDEQSYTPCLTIGDSVEGQLNFWIDTLNADGNDVGPGIYMDNNPTPEGFDEDQLNNWINIYPNPADEYMTIQIRNAQIKPVDLKIFDIAGKLILNLPEFNKPTLLISPDQLVPGIYLLQIERNGLRYLNKIVLE